MKQTLVALLSCSSCLRDAIFIIMVNSRNKESEVPLCAFFTFLLTHCYAVMAILQKKGYIEDVQKNYKIEDFLWSGSGDGENETELSTSDEEIWWEYTTTIFQTTTVFSIATSTATIYRNKWSITTSTPRTSVTPKCTEDASCTIKPTPTVRLPGKPISPWPPPTNRSATDEVPEQRYWLITVLKLNASAADATTLSPMELEDHLAKLYKLAFHRHQDRHLGFQNYLHNKSVLRSLHSFHKRAGQRDEVTVHVHNVSSEQVLNILYSVRVSGRPVLATTAAHDMKFVSDAEVVAELGYPVLTKAEPFLKQPLQASPEELVSWKRRHTFILVAVGCIVALILVLLVLGFIAVEKYKKIRDANRRKIEDERFLKTRSRMLAGETVERSANDGNRGRAEMKPSSSASHELDPKDESTIDHPVGKCYLKGSRSRGASSPNSFLSMPSVKNFPATLLPEPLTSVLNNGSSPSATNRNVRGQKFSRHSSLGDDDPGVVGPVVWEKYCKQYEEKETAIEVSDTYSADENVDVKQMRKRFNRLLDEALHLYGNHTFSDDEISVNRRMSAAERKRDGPPSSVSSRNQTAAAVPLKAQSRPRTSSNFENFSAQRMLAKSFHQPRNAWCSSVPCTPVRLHSRPLSAGPFHRPAVRPEFIFADSQLSSNDPAVPIISAIKRELQEIPSYERRHSNELAAKTKPTTSSCASFESY